MKGITINGIYDIVVLVSIYIYILQNQNFNKIPLVKKLNSSKIIIVVRFFASGIHFDDTSTSNRLTVQHTNTI